MLLECAVADAYGAGFEYNDEALPFNDLTRYVQHSLHTGIRPGMYTDDTQMSLAVAECLVSSDEWTPANIVKHFLACFLRDPRDGYARRFQKFLEDPANQTPDGFLANIRPDSQRSGAAMRAGPIGVVCRNLSTVKGLATVQAETTHRTKAGVDSACAAALMGWFLHNTVEPKQHLPTFLNSHVPGYDWASPWRGKVGVEGIPCVRAALTAILEHDNQADMLRWIVNLRGDVDTVAAIALSAASTPLMGGPVTENLPDVLVAELENGPYGRDYLIDLDLKLVRTWRD